MVAVHAGLRSKQSSPTVRFVEHASFHESDAAAVYRPKAVTPETLPAANSHLADEDTRDLAKRMHYAAFRLAHARGHAQARTWRNHYLGLRDLIILGNRKLIYRAVHTRVRDPQLAEDCASECHLVMIRAVSSYNPWLGIRFSTYAFTCLLRELTRLVQRQTKDRLRQAASVEEFLFEDLFAAEAIGPDCENPAAILDPFFAHEHPLLDEREKQILSQRFGFNADGSVATLGDIGNELNISKERVRQLQNSGLDKLRAVLAAHFKN